MFSMKIFNDKKFRKEEFNRTMNNIVDYIFEKLQFEDPKVISDSSCIEIISGKEEPPKEDEVVIELLIRKHIVINNRDFNDRDKLDRHISKIKHFCEQAKNIEDLQYLPINMRE